MKIITWLPQYSIKGTFRIIKKNQTEYFTYASFSHSLVGKESLKTVRFRQFLTVMNIFLIFVILHFAVGYTMSAISHRSHFHSNRVGIGVLENPIPDSGNPIPDSWKGILLKMTKKQKNHTLRKQKFQRTSHLRLQRFNAFHSRKQTEIDKIIYISSKF